jgi:hypothetical protein
MLIRTLWISASLLLSSFALAAPTPASSAATSSTPNKACADLPGRVFKNCVDGSFPGLHALEVSKDFTTFLDITDGTAGNLVTWSIVASHEPGHNKIIDVKFKAGSNFYGLFNVMPAAGTEDLSAYAKGALEFDVRILDRGLYNVPLEVKLECVYPCQSKEHVLDVPTLNQWTSISLPIADFVAEGLDLTKVNIPFQIFPAWGVQDGAHFQVDNIRWVKKAPKSSSSQGAALSSKSSSKATSSVASLKSSAKSASSVKSAVTSSSKASSAPSSIKASSASSVKSSKASSVKSSASSVKSSDSSVKSSNSSVKSSVASSAQSSSVPLSCNYQEGGVYFDSTCATWAPISAYEQNNDFTVSQEVLNGVGAFVNFAEVDSTDGNHQKVIDVLFKDDPTFNGMVRFHPPVGTVGGLDMSAYATGKVIFDIKVIANSNDNAPLEFVLDCGWPCQNTEKLLRLPAVNQWTTIEVPVADLIRDGLTITNVLTGFQILPSWGHQIGAHFQLDNIRWVKGPNTPASTQVCWAQRFDRYDIANLRIDGFQSSGEFPIQITQIAPSTIFPTDWLHTSKWGYTSTTNSSFAGCGAVGTVSANVYLPASYVNDGYLRVSFYAMDPSIGMTFSVPVSVVGLKGDDWNIINVPLWFSSNVDDPNAAYLGVIFDANGKDPSIGGALKVDNIMITRPIQ